ncbi:MAG: hypothetical protein EOP06_02625 [Proteobacteria bacterium]|nr:MAG: hypothetical protein EOP06_02625 [Pseudomonadota bacterium]
MKYAMISILASASLIACGKSDSGNGSGEYSLPTPPVENLFCSLKLSLEGEADENHVATYVGTLPSDCDLTLNKTSGYLGVEVSYSYAGMTVTDLNFGDYAIAVPQSVQHSWDVFFVDRKKLTSSADPEIQSYLSKFALPFSSDRKAIRVKAIISSTVNSTAYLYLSYWE